MPISRREFIKLTGVGAGAIYFGGCASLLKTSAIGGGVECSPIYRGLGDVAPKTFSGDESFKAHSIFWNKAATMQSVAQTQISEEHTDIVVIGGGMAGLSSAYFLRDLKPLLLEQASRFGGNSKGESWRGIDYAIGAAYCCTPEGEVLKFFKAIGVDHKVKPFSDDEPLGINGKLITKYWENGTCAENKGQFRRLKAYLDGVRVPEIPIAPGTQADELVRIHQLDKTSFKSHIESVLGGALHPHLEGFLEQYCWSAFSGEMAELSAACGLNFFAGDSAGVAVAPGGNAAIAEAITESLYTELGRERMRTNAMVFDLVVDADGVQILYSDQKQQVHRIRAKYAMVSCPKFVAAHIIQDLEAERLEAMKSLKYRAYLVANLLVEARVEDHIRENFYDLTFFNDRNWKASPRKIKTSDRAKRIGATDVVRNSGRSGKPMNVLTFYRSLPYDQGRSEVFSPGAYDQVRREFEAQIHSEVLPMFGLRAQHIVDLRLARWGHPIPLAGIGNIASGRTDWLRKPFKQRVFFAEQDNWALPSFETAFCEASYMSGELRRAMGTF